MFQRVMAIDFLQIRHLFAVFEFKDCSLDLPQNISYLIDKKGLQRLISDMGGLGSDV